MWISSHVGIYGNEQPDRLPKQATSITITDIEIYLGKVNTGTEYARKH